MRADVLDFYRRDHAMTAPGRHAAALAAAPADVAGMTRFVQGLLLHLQWSPAYGVQLSPLRREEAHIRAVVPMLDCALQIDPAPLGAARPLERRLVGVCRHFTVLMVAVLRAKGVPARSRCGFGAYFTPGVYEDHWVAEYWNAERACWVLVDAQLDDVQSQRLGLDFDPLDVPRDRFLVAYDAWRRMRAGRAAPEAFGIADIRGAYFAAGNVVRDFAALNGVETLPWDCWGAALADPQPLAPDYEALIDRLAALTATPDDSFEELLSKYREDERLRVPARVFNVLRRVEETI
jgi:hypothetical protein